MASVHDYNFNQSTRLGDDKTDLSQRTLQNSDYATYMLDTFRPTCPMGDVVEFATSQPNVNFTGSFHTSVGGSNIQENSQLLISSLSRPNVELV